MLLPKWQNFPGACPVRNLSDDSQDSNGVCKNTIQTSLEVGDSLLTGQKKKIWVPARLGTEPGKAGPL